MALIHTAPGDRESAISWLDRASRDRDSWFLYANVDPRLDGPRSDPRSRKLLNRGAMAGVTP